jgi:hypothetical protein
MIPSVDPEAWSRACDQFREIEGQVLAYEFLEARQYLLMERMVPHVENVIKAIVESLGVVPNEKQMDDLHLHLLGLGTIPLFALYKQEELDRPKSN